MGQNTKLDSIQQIIKQCFNQHCQLLNFCRFVTYLDDLKDVWKNVLVSRDWTQIKVIWLSIYSFN